MTPIEAAETWLSVMPAIPLGRGCPVVYHNATAPDRSITGHDLVIDVAMGLDGLCRLAINDGTDAVRNWRIDLDSPIGFGYALRWLAIRRQTLTPDQVVSIPADLCARHWFDATTEADRMELALEVRAASVKP